MSYMLTNELLNTSIPRLQLQDTAAKALELIDDLRLTHLPVVAGEKFAGLISEDTLMEADENVTIESLQESLLQRAVADNEHFLSAVNFCNKYESSIVPVVNEDNELNGVITSNDLLKLLGNFTGCDSIGGIIVLEMERNQFAISEISRITESNDATILHLNTIINPETGILTVTIHLNKKDLSSIVATFERYEYNIVGYFGNERFENEINSNFRHLMNYLDI